MQKAALALGAQTQYPRTSPLPCTPAPLPSRSLTRAALAVGQDVLQPLLQLISPLPLQVQLPLEVLELWGTGGRGWLRPCGPTGAAGGGMLGHLPIIPQHCPSSPRSAARPPCPSPPAGHRKQGWWRPEGLRAVPYLPRPGLCAETLGVSGTVWGGGGKGTCFRLPMVFR